MNFGAAAGVPPDSGAASLRVVPVGDRRALDMFVRLPARLYRSISNYVPPLTLERRDALNPGKNPYFEHARASFWLALRGVEPVGRISAQVDRLYLERYRDDTGHFGFLDAEDDPAVFRALTQTAEQWLRDQGMRRALGPFSLSVNEECGLMVDGFAEHSVLMMGWSPPYAAARVEELGYAKAKDLVAYDYDVLNAPPMDPKGLFGRLAAKQGLKIRKIDMKRYRQDVHDILAVFNDAWADNWGFVPLTEAEIEHTAKSLRPLVWPEVVWIAELNGEPVGMIVAMPNLNEAIRGLGGALLPFGWARLLWRLKVAGVRTGRLALFGVRRRLRGTSLGGAIALLLLESLRSGGRGRGAVRCELSWVLEDNTAMRRLIEGVGGRVYKTYRIYEKALA